MNAKKSTLTERVHHIHSRFPLAWAVLIATRKGWITARAISAQIVGYRSENSKAAICLSHLSKTGMLVTRKIDSRQNAYKARPEVARVVGQLLDEISNPQEAK